MKNHKTASLLSLLFPLLAGAAETAADFAGAKPEPVGLMTESVSQLRIRFPQGIVKNLIKGEAFKVICSPAVEGFSSWADNNTIWTFDFKAKDYESPRLVGGARCEVTQVAELKGVDGAKWAAGSIHYSVSAAGPNVKSVQPAYGFNGSLREKETVVLIKFDGPVNRTKFFAEQNGFLSYLSSDAPAEKIPLVAVPADQEKKILSYFNSNSADLDEKSPTWLFATVKQNLIPGAKLRMTIANQVSESNVDIRSVKTFSEEFSVRSQFQAEITCDNPGTKAGVCLPHSPISVSLNGQVKWADIRNAYIEYLPYKSTDRKVVRSYPELKKNGDETFWNRFIDSMSGYFPFLARFSDTVVDSIEFKVDIEPQTIAKVVLPAGLTDIDGRQLSNAIGEFHLKIGAVREAIQMPQPLSFFEKNVPNLALPVGIINVNQKVSIRKSGTDNKNWAPIRDVPTMIRLIRAYNDRGNSRESVAYQSPLEKLGVASSVTQQQLRGQKNHPTMLSFPFGQANDGSLGGLYAIEVTSSTYEAVPSDDNQKRFRNPEYVLAQVTDLAVHLKKGTRRTLAWVTHLSNAQPAVGADVAIYNCLGEPVKNLKTNGNGIVSFNNEEWATDCQTAENDYSSFAEKNQFFIVASLGGDQSLTHSSWASSSGGIYNAPGLHEYGSLSDGSANYHAIVGVNLVKPGQMVPIEFVARMPVSKGFAEVKAVDLPTIARITSTDDERTYYEFPLTWKNGLADIAWQVPGDSSVRIGRYSIKLMNADEKNQNYLNADIEVAEFKVPLMTGLISLPNVPLVQPESLPVNAVVRYANGVGAKNLTTDLSYYFEPTQIQRTKFADFAFGSGPMLVEDMQDEVGNGQVLPNSSRPATISDLSTGADGSLVKDLALEKIPDGRTIAEVLKSVGRPQRLVVRLRYQDQIGEYQTISQAKEIYNSPFYIGTNLQSGTRADSKLRAVVMGADKKVVTNLEDLELKVLRVETKVIGEELFGGLIKNTLERTLLPVRWVSTCSLVKGVASCPVGALKSGNYAFQATIKSLKQSSHTLFKVDDQGRVYGQNDRYMYGDEDGSESIKQMPLALNKKSYKNGDVAIVSFSPPFKNCQALVTLERNDVLQSFVVANACEKGAVEIPVDANLAPNAYVSIYAVTGRAPNTKAILGETDLGRPTYRLGYSNLKVDWSRFRSNVSVKTDQEKYEPGQTVNVAVQVQPEEGQLATGSVTLVAIEEKILELKANETYQLLNSLMSLRSSEVETVTPLERIQTISDENPDRASAPRKGGNEGGDGSSKAEFKRKLFNALVTFQANVPLVNGVAHFSFKTNDSLTRFKIFAISTDSNQKFGTGEATYLTEKDTQAYSNIPSVAHTGDSFPVKVTIQNNGGKTSSFRAKVTATIKDSSGNVIATRELSKDVTIDNASSASVDVGQVSIDDNASRIEYVVHIYDADGKLVDAMEPDAQVILASVPLAIHDSFLTQMSERDWTQELTKEPEALSGQGEVRVTVAKSLVGTAIQQIARRMSQNPFTDFFLESRFDRALLSGSEADSKSLVAVLETMNASTDEEGFIKPYSEARRGSLWLTASVLNSLQQEPWAMKLVPVSLMAKLRGAVSSVLTKSVDPVYVGTSAMDWMRAQSVMGRAAFAFKDENLLSAARALVVTFAANLRQDPKAFGETLDLWSNADLLNYWLLQVVADSKTAAQSSVYQQLLNPARLVYAGNSARLAGQASYLLCYSDETMETAQLLWGHSQLRADKNVARALAAGLVNSNEKSWYGAVTQMAVAQALKNFGRSYEMATVSGSALVAVVQTQKSVTVDWSKSGTATLVSNWPEARATVKVTHAGEGLPWVGVQALSAVPLTSARNQGLSVEKEIRNLNRDSGYQAGDLIEVTLRLRASTLVNHIALQDPIPAGSNIVGEMTGADSGQKSYSGYKMYFSSVGTSVTTVTYQYQLNNPGSFKLPPTRAEGLYMPSVFGETPNETLKVH